MNSKRRCPEAWEIARKLTREKPGYYTNRQLADAAGVHSNSMRYIVNQLNLSTLKGRARGTSKATLSVEDIPYKLYKKLKQDAEKLNCSNAEIIVPILERHYKGTDTVERTLKNTRNILGALVDGLDELRMLKDEQD